VISNSVIVNLFSAFMWSHPKRAQYSSDSFSATMIIATSSVRRTTIVRCSARVYKLSPCGPSGRRDQPPPLSVCQALALHGSRYYIAPLSQPVPDNYAFQANDKRTDEQTNSTSPLRIAPSFLAGLNNMGSRC